MATLKQKSLSTGHGHFKSRHQYRVTAVARKRSRSFCQKWRWQVTAKHAYTLRMWLCVKWHGAWLYGVHRTCAETAAVSCGTSHASAVSRYTTSVDIQKHSCRITCERSESARESGEWRYIKETESTRERRIALWYKSNQQQQQQYP